MIELSGNRDARSRALAEVARLDQRLADGRPAWLSDDEAALVRAARWLNAEAAGEPPSGRTPGERLINSATWHAYRGDGEGMAYSPETALIAVATADEFVHLAATLNFPEISRTFVDQGAVKPLASPLVLFEPVPVEDRRVAPLALSGTEPDGFGVPPGAASPEVVITSSDADRLLIRWAGHGNAARTDFLSDERAKALIDNVLLRSWWRALAEEVLTGDGSTTASRQQLRGVLNTAGVGTVAVAASNRVGAVMAAIASIENAGFSGPHAIVANPTDKLELLGQADYRSDRFPTLEQVIGFDRIPAGTSFVGQIGAGRLISTPLMINVSPDHSSNFPAAIVTIQPEAFLDVDFPHPASMCVITGM